MKRDYKKLTPFKYFCLTSFPFIESDFDALTNYELLCKIACYSECIADRVNELTDEQINLLAEMRTLKKRVDDFISDLDIQEEVNNKLDEMAESGELAELLRTYLGQTAEVFVKGCWTSIADLYYPSEPELKYPYSYQNLAVVKFGDKVLLMDSGYRYIPDDESSLTDDDIQNISELTDEMTEWFNSIEVEHIDYIYISHYDYDHASGLPLIASLSNNTMIKDATIYLPQTPVFSKVTESVARYYQEIEGLVVSQSLIKVVPTESNSEFDLSALLKLKFYNTDHSSYYESEDFDYNNCSLVCELVNGNTHILDVGDINVDAQEEICEKLAHVDLLFATHHGSNISESADYIRSVCPDVLLVQNGNGRSVSGALDYLNRYSFENNYAQKRGINVFTTSEAQYGEEADYCLHFYFNSFAIVFTNGNILNAKTLETLNGVSDVTGKGFADNVSVKAQDFLDNMPNNTINIFSLGQSYHITPIEDTGSWMQILIKTVSGNTSNVYQYEPHSPYYFFGIYSDNKYGKSSDLVGVRAGRYDNHDDSDFSLVNLLSCAYHKFEKTEGDVTADSSWTKYAVNNEPYKFGDNFELVSSGEHSGELLCKNTGVYKVTLTSQTRVGISGSSSYCHYQLRDSDNTIYARTIHYFGAQPTYSSDTDIVYIEEGTYLKLVHLGGNYSAHDYVSVLLEERSHIRKISKDNFFKDEFVQEV